MLRERQRSIALYLMEYASYIVVDGILCKTVNYRDTVYTWPEPHLVVLPPKLRKEVVWMEHHSEPQVALTHSKTLQQIGHKWYWPYWQQETLTIYGMYGHDNQVNLSNWRGDDLIRDNQSEAPDIYTLNSWIYNQHEPDEDEWPFCQVGGLGRIHQRCSRVSRPQWHRTLRGKGSGHSLSSGASPIEVYCFHMVPKSWYRRQKSGSNHESHER